MRLEKIKGKRIDAISEYKKYLEQDEKLGEEEK